MRPPPTGGRAQGDWAINGVSIDTRSLKPGDLFVALKDVRDGHDFVATPSLRGAALVSHSSARCSGRKAGADRADVLPALERMGLAARARTKRESGAASPGSVGKTSTKEMLRAILSPGRATAAEASYNNHWGVPLTLARMPVETSARSSRSA
jgi:UDP-N-acetylmuramoyl-tripeptide--D-alanyl-D-alanine ligase